ncbi:MAG: hypothetical protein QXZ44_07350 [Ferroplasma sp.]
MNVRKYLTLHNRVFIPLIGIFYSTLVFYLALIDADFLVLVFSIPVVIFLLMHYLNMYKFKPRFFGGLTILVIVLLIAAGMYSTYFYDSSGITKETVNGTFLETTTAPFSGVDKNYTITITTNYTGNLNSSYLIISSASAHTNITYAHLNATKKGDMTTMHYSTYLAPGLYDSNYTINKDTYIYSPGPVNVGRTPFYEYYVYAVGIEYMASIAILYIIGLTVAYFMKRNNVMKQ